MIPKNALPSRILFIMYVSIFFLSTSVSYSQTLPGGPEDGSSYALPKVILPGPDAASLGKYGDIPVGKYTGTANVSIPLYNTSLGNLSIPITLNYFSSGLKVEELSSWVGLGWSLSAGGVITRTVHNKPDEGIWGYWIYGDKTDDWLAYQRVNPQINPLWLGKNDLEPDMFYYNFLGRSGKFVMDAAAPHTAHTIPYQSLQIQHTSTLSGFTITDENGNQFVFDVEEKTILDDPSEYTSAWYLSKIITSAGEITLSYYGDLGHTNMLNFSSVDYTFIEPGGLGTIQLKAADNPVVATEINSAILKQITTPSEVIKFYVDQTARKDISGGSILDHITVEDYAGALKKKFSLSHSYFGNPTRTQPEYFRLKLDAITENSVSDQQSKTYTLNYYSPEDVPATTSKDQDSWGYFNGAGNLTLLPPVSPIDYLIALPKEGGDRQPSFNSALSGVLQSIIYPTGGSSTFIYENNDYGYVKGIPINEEIQNSQSVKAEAIRSSLVNISSDIKTFTIINRQKVILTMDGDFTGPTPVENGPEVTLNKINADNTRTEISYHALLHTSSIAYPELQPGNYELIAKVDGTPQNAWIRVDYKTPSGIILKTKLCGGVRIKQIINTDPVTNKVNTTNFDYNLTDEDNHIRSSGDIMSEPSFIEYKGDFLVRSSYTLGYLGTTQGSHVGYQRVTEFKSSADQTNGKIESYFSTIPKNKNGTDNQITMHDVEHPFIPHSEPEKFVTDYDVYRGQLQKEITYDAQNLPVKEVINSYNADPLTAASSPNYFELLSRKAYSFIYYSTMPQATGPGAGWIQGAFGDPPIFPIYIPYLTHASVVCPWIYKTKEVARVYDPSDPTRAHYLETVTNFFYDNPTHGLLTRTETFNSKGESVQTITKYPQDNFTDLSTTAEAARQDLITHHNITPVLERTTLKNTNIPINSIHTDYRIWPSGSNSPEYIQTQKGQSNYNDRIQFYGYDATGNILEQSKSHDAHEIYVWGYKKKYPIAKIIGGTSTAVNQINLNQSILDAPVSDHALRTELNRLRMAYSLKDALITTFTYEPLVGVTSETDPNGRTTYYEYDGFGRLSLIKDQNGNIIKAFDYKYYNQ